MKTDPPQPSAPPTPEPGGQLRTFTLNTPEAYAALCPRDEEEPWIRAGSLPRQPRARNLPVVREG